MRTYATHIIIKTSLSLLSLSPVPAASAQVPVDDGAARPGEPPAVVSSPSRPVVAGSRAKIIRGKAYAPQAAPLSVKKIIWAGNKIRNLPYSYGGGHGSFSASGYDCSGSVSYALHGGGLLRSPLDSSGLASWGRRGKGKWVTVHTNAGHAFLVVAGLRFDTSGARPNRWQPNPRGWGSGYTLRHPLGL